MRYNNIYKRITLYIKWFPMRYSILLKNQDIMLFINIKYCDGRQGRFSINHAPDCKKGGLITARHQMNTVTINT